MEVSGQFFFSFNYHLLGPMRSTGANGSPSGRLEKNRMKINFIIEHAGDYDGNER